MVDEFLLRLLKGRRLGELQNVARLILLLMTVSRKAYGLIVVTELDRDASSNQKYQYRKL